MSINKIMLGCFAFIGTLALLTFLSVVQLNRLTDGIEATSQIRYLSYQAADELRQSSDDLTRLGRTYVVTGDSKYENMYMDILDIRNGKKPRPEKYHGIYWDLVIDYGSKPKPDGETLALASRMRELGFTDEEFALLKDAQVNSDALVNMEVLAMNAVKGKFPDSNGDYSIIGVPDFKTARNLLHSIEYHQEKAKIMAPIDQFLDQLETRTNEEFAVAIGNAKILSVITTGLMVLVVISAIVGYIMVTRLVTKPVSKMSLILSKMGRDKDLTSRLETRGNNEISQIAENVNELIDGYSYTINNTKETHEQVAQVIEAITTLNESNLMLSDQQAAELGLATGAITEMTDALSLVSTNTHEAESHAAKADSGASQGRSVVDSANKSFSELETDFEATMSTIEELVNGSNSVGNVLDVIKAIAEQTNLLALNAAIEAARAGEQGRGFAVVADEVRSLAKRTQESTGEIENMISSLQAQAKQATLSIKESAEKITETSEKVNDASQVLAGIQQSASDIHNLNSAIASATEEQLAVSGEISKNLDSIKTLSSDIGGKVQTLMPLVMKIQTSTVKMQQHAEQYKVA